MVEAHLSARAFVAALGNWNTFTPTYVALADRIQLLIVDGRIPVATRLTAERDLASHLGISRTTVTAAYRRLRDAGFAESTRGSGSVARMPSRASATTPLASDDLLDFSRAALPATVRLPAAARNAAAALPAYVSGSGYDPIGLPDLRSLIAARYTEQGLATAVDEILVTIGAQQAIALIARTLLARGDRVLLETPTYPNAADALRLAGARLVSVPIADRTSAGDGTWSADDTSVADGTSPPDAEAESLARAVRRVSPNLVYVMPDFHNPTGRTMPVEERIDLLAAAADQGTILVSDETTAGLDIERPGSFSTLALYATTAAERASVLLVGSASKSLWGGLRIGWIRADPVMIRRLAAAKPSSDLGTPILDQLVACELLPVLDDILEERRVQLRNGRDGLRTALALRFPEWEMPPIDGGLAAWVNIGSPVSSQLALAARNSGLLIAAGPRFGIDGAFERFLRIPITYGPAEIARAVDALSTAWESLTARPLHDSEYLAEVV